jgi:predicted NAD-dependent protein-ADP-ribosyltransferase YbiA (DUF1768 family)
LKNNKFFPLQKQPKEQPVNLNALLDETDWYSQERFKVLYQLNLAKFSQNDEFKLALLNTGDLEIIALSTKSPYYTIAYDTKKECYGGNRLGIMMMTVRDEIIKGVAPVKNTAQKQLNDISVEYTTFNPANDASQQSDKNLKLLHQYGVHNQWDEKQVVVFPQLNDWLSNRYPCSIVVQGVEYDSTEKAFQIAKVDYAIKQKTELQLNDQEIAALEATKETMQSLSSVDRINDIVDEAKVNQFRSQEQRRAQIAPSPK